MNQRLATLGPSLIREINSRKRPGDIDLGLGEPVLRPDAEPFRRAAEWVAAHGCLYSPLPGFQDLRAMVDPDPSRVIITHGSQEALYLGMRAAVAGDDEVLLVEPAYPAYEKICQMEGLRYRTVAMDAADGFAPRAAPVLDALRPETRLVVLASPVNPTARVWPRAELELLAAGLGDRWALSDEVYRELYYTEAPPVSLAAFHARTLVAGGLSKSHAVTGLRLGWLVAPKEIVTAATRAHQLITTSASTLSQRVAVELLGGAGATERTRAIYREQRAALLEALERERLPHVIPEGAFYCMVRIPSKDSLQAAHALLDAERVVTVPGIAFGASAEGWLRLSWCGEPQPVAEGLARMARFFAAR